MPAVQDPVAVAPEIYRVLFENERVRVLEARLKPGDKTEMHVHPANVVYSFTAAALRFTSPDGSVDVSLKPDEVMAPKAGQHATTNVGSTEARALIIELK